MAVSPIDAALIDQLDALRSRVGAKLASTESAELIQIAQQLDRLALDVRQGDVDEPTLVGQLNSLAEQFDVVSAAVEADDETSAALILETIPTSRRHTLLAQNQARLVERALESAKTDQNFVFDGVEAALRTYAQQSRIITDTPAPAQLQQRLSAAVQERIDRVALMPTDQVDAVIDGAPFTGVDSSGSLSADLATILSHRDLFRSEALRNALLTGEMTLATVQDGPDGRQVTPHDVRLPAVEEEQAEPEAPVERESDDEALVAQAAADDALVASMRARLSELTVAMETSHAVADDEREHAQSLAGRVAALQSKARRSAAALASWQANQQDQERLHALLERTRATAQKVVRHQLQGLVDVATAAIAAGDPEQAAAIGAVSEHIATLAADSPPAAIRAASQQLVGALQGSGDDVIARAEQFGLGAEQAASSTHFAPALQTMPAPAETTTEGDATSLLQRQLRRFEQATLRTAMDHEQVLATRSVMGEDGPQYAAPKPVQLASSQVGSVQLEKLDYAQVEQTMHQRLRELRGLEGLHGRTASVDLFADRAGLERAPVAERAVRRRPDPAALAGDIIARASAELRRQTMARRAGQLRRSAGSVASTDSGRRELGVPTPDHYEMEPSVAPLFKRKIGVDRGGLVGKVYLPALYKVSGVEAGPLRKKSWSGGSDPLAAGRMYAKMDQQGDGIDLEGANLDLIKIVEKYFGNAGPSGEEMAAYGEDPTQGEDFQKYVGNEGFRVASAVSGWVASRNQNLAEMASARPVDQFSTGQLDPETLVSNLKSEAAQIPTSVQERLQPFLGGTDLSAVRIYSGPVAAMASAAMGAHAFTLKKHVFFAGQQLDFESPEGMSLLAHELVHTAHFDQAGSVDAKEREAEEVELRIRRAFGSQNDRSFALEDRGDPNTSSQALTAGARNANDFAVSEAVGPNKGGFRPSYDPDTLIDAVAEICVERMSEDMQKESARFGSDSVES